MPVTIDKNAWLQLFVQRKSPNMFLQSLFSVPPGGNYYGDKVSIDIQRFGEAVAVAIRKGRGLNMNEADVFTTKTFTPPSYGEAIPFDVLDLLNRRAGVDPYTDAYNDYTAQLIANMMNNFMLINDKIIRGIELQASQILQTGTLTLTDNDGDTVYSLNFQPKSSHFPTVTTAWSNSASNKISDLQSLLRQVKRDGKVSNFMAIMGRTASRQFMEDTAVQNLLDNRRIEVGEIAPADQGEGATFLGRIFIDNQFVELWTYDDEYENPNGGALTPYIEEDKVVVLSRSTRLDRVAAKVPLPLGPDPRVETLMPGRLIDQTGVMDVTPNLYCSNDGKEIFGSLESKTLLIPVQIDGFGCLDTNP